MSYGYSVKFFRFFFDFRRKISKDFGQLFTESTNENVKKKTMDSKWGWYNIIYGLCGDNILNIDKVTRRPILEVLTFLAYRQDNNNTKSNNYDQL